MSSTNLRVLITGSRNYAERYNNLSGKNGTVTPAEANEAKRLDLIDMRKAWQYFMQAVTFAKTKGLTSVTFVHGACPKGFDKICSEWVQKFNDPSIQVIEEPHPADWVEHGPKAGPIRNSHVVQLGANFGIAGWDGSGSGSGTFDCMSKAAKANIDLKICTPQPGIEI